MGAEALAFHIRGLREDGDPIPAPSSLEAVMADPESAEGIAVLVSAPDSPHAAVHVELALPENDLAAIDTHAARRGLSRSDFLLEAARREIERAG